jgi:hypothetical protein
MHRLTPDPLRNAITGVSSHLIETFRLIFEWAVLGIELLAMAGADLSMNRRERT